ncbi:MAG: hypothetical protein GX680_08025 [Bacteroidales bacterium]|nr:hypothetical protein [Bacteroidales bacterium]
MAKIKRSGVPHFPSYKKSSMLSLRQKAKECCMMDMILHENAIDFNSLERKIYEYGCNVACDFLKDCFQKLDTMLMKSRDKAIYPP